MPTKALHVWQLASNAAPHDALFASRPPDFVGTGRLGDSGQLHLEVVSGVPTGDPTATFFVEGLGAFELVRREGTRSVWGMRRRLMLTLRPRTPASETAAAEYAHD